MSRLSPITLSLAAIMVAVLSVGVFLFVHSRPVRHEPPADVEPVAAPAAPPPQPAREPPPAPPPPAAPAVAVAQPAAEVDAQPFADDPQPPPNRRGLLVINHNRRLQEADENVFMTLSMPESTRASIRQINEEFRRRTEPAGDGGATASPQLDVPAASRARQDSLSTLLGVESAKSFESEERVAVMRLRGKYRYEWGRQLRQ